MALDFQQIQQQVKELGERAPERARALQSLRDLALGLLKAHADNLDGLREKVEMIAANYDPSLRCALPVTEALDVAIPAPEPVEHATILAADGSQITPDRHEEVEYGLINVGAIVMRRGSAEAPKRTVTSRLLYDEQLTNLSEATLALRRDVDERKILAEMAEGASAQHASAQISPAAQVSPAAPIISFTDGPMELWGGRTSNPEERSEFQTRLEEYQSVLRRLHTLNVATAGYVDKPAARTVVRLLEVAQAPAEQLPEIKKFNPLRGVRDIDLYRLLLGPSERSAVFKIQSQFADAYPEEMAVHFFYLNVGEGKRSALARVEVPAWVVEAAELLDGLHATLVEQCRIMGSRPYPYLLHRAHETAVVTLPEREQVTQMISLELRRRGVAIEGASFKQSAKDLAGRKTYDRGGQQKR